MVMVRPRKTLRCRRASLAPVADRERCLHLMIKKGEGRRECGVYTQIGGIQQGGVNRLFQRRNRTVSIGGVADSEFREHILLVAGDAELLARSAAMGAHLGPGIMKSFAAHPCDTVPMSRPSITAPSASPGDAAQVPLKSNNRANLGIAATAMSAPTTSLR